MKKIFNRAAKLQARLSQPEAKVFAGLFASVCIALLWSLSIGAMPIPIPTILETLSSLIGLTDTDTIDPRFSLILIEVRLPRLILSCAVGATLGISGAAMQGILRNPLAEPGLLGTASGAALGAVAVIVLEGAFLQHHNFSPYAVPCAAFIGALVCTGIVVLMAKSVNIPSSATLLLTGIAINALAGSAIGLLISIANDEQLRSLTFWMMGSLASANWTHCAVVTVVGGISGLVIYHYSLALDATALGDHVAGHLGLDAVRIRGRVLTAVAMAVGAGVSFVGMIGFVGLVAPHLVRMMVGARHKYVIPGSALLGAVLVTLADLAARTIVAPSELPLGILTGILGGPFLLWLLVRVGQQESGS